MIRNERATLGEVKMGSILREVEELADFALAAAKGYSEVLEAFDLRHEVVPRLNLLSEEIEKINEKVEQISKENILQYVLERLDNEAKHRKQDMAQISTGIGRMEKAIEKARNDLKKEAVGFSRRNAAREDTTSDGAISTEEWSEVLSKKKRRAPRTFAQMVKSEIKRNVSNDRASTILVSNPNLSPQSTRREVMKAIDPAAQGIKIRAMRTKGKEGVVLATASQEDNVKIQSNVQLRNAGFTVQESMGDNPRLRVHGVQAELAPEEFVRAAFAQNFQGNWTESMFRASFKPLFKTGKRDLDTVIWVVETSPEMRRAVLNQGRLYIKWDSCWVADFVRVSRCFKCQAFDHVAKFCRGVEICKHCAAEGHKEEACPAKNEPPKCSNCRRAKEDDGHAVTSENCPAYNWAVRKRLRRTNYGKEAEQQGTQQPPAPCPRNCDSGGNAKRDREEASPQGPSEKRVISDLDRPEPPVTPRRRSEGTEIAWKELCRHCFKYGHTTSQCRSLVAACEHCGLEGHKVIIVKN
ncbi:unnamed protein product [Nesidiocoris tenuis]|uniref:CCHC-type domain-containing protein n=1 Tax=Nesidiocoris tenuis TaxID=355587 RepID=A0A6H5HNJ9_9HEMI|nr:unnamed protein product [Nesidiocoris tenuis]